MLPNLLYVCSKGSGETARMSEPSLLAYMILFELMPVDPVINFSVTLGLFLHLTSTKQRIVSNSVTLNLNSSTLPDCPPSSI